MPNDLNTYINPSNTINPDVPAPNTGGGGSGDPYGIGALIGAGASIYQQEQQNRFTELQNRIDRGYATKADLRAYKQLISGRDYDNWYNSPAQLMDRYRQAGLNPNLIYGSGGISMASKTATLSPHVVQGRAKKSIAGEIPQNALMQHMLLAQIKNINADTEKKKGDTQDAGLKGANTLADINNKKQDLLNKQQLMRNLEQTNLNSKEQNQILQIQKATQQKDWEYFRDYNIKSSDPYWLKQMIMQSKDLIDSASGTDRESGILNLLGDLFRSIPLNQNN